MLLLPGVFLVLPDGISVLMAGILTIPAFLLTMLTAFYASFALVFITALLRISLRPTTFGAMVGAITGLIYSIPFFVNTSPIYYSAIVPTMFGLLFQVGGFLGAQKYQIQYPNQLESEHRPVQFGIKQVMLATAQFAVLLVVAIEISNALEILAIVVLIVIQVIVFHFASYVLTRWKTAQS